MRFKDNNFLIFGLGVSGVAASKLLLNLKANVYIFDEKKAGGTQTAGKTGAGTQIAGKDGAQTARGEGGGAQNDGGASWEVQSLINSGCVWVDEKDMFDVSKDMYCFVLSPSVPLENKYVQNAKQLGILVISEIELASCLTRCPILAVTGTNGKSTTVSLIHHILKGCGYRSSLLGNIGVAFSSEVLKLTPEEFVCLEVSSYQLETTLSFKPHIATITNLQPDHLTRHKTVENYYKQKLRVFKNMGEGEFAVLNADDSHMLEIAKNLRTNTFFYSTKREVRGSYIRGDGIYFQSGELSEYIMDINEIKILGKHNLLNTLSAITFAKLCGGKNEEIRSAVMSFHGLEHRFEFVDMKGGALFINDSKATNIASTLTAVEAADRRVVLILGGSDKGEDFSLLFENLSEKVSHAVLYGEMRYKLLDAAIEKKFYAVTVCQEFDKAVRTAYYAASSGECVLLSPACASFDCFKNFEERGRRFKQVVGEL